MQKSKNKVLRVGFDLDGVLLYNPARIVRPLVVYFKKIFLKKEINKFHLPKSKLQKFFWLFLHKSSFIVAPGLSEIKKMIQDNKIEAYVISARYEFLKKDFNKWLKKIDCEKYFSGTFFNNDNQQPFIFKRKMINKLKLDLFVEDNWDIVKFLTKNTKAKIFWIYNLFDKNIEYNLKFPNLKKAIQKIRSYAK